MSSTEQAFKKDDGDDRMTDLLA